MSQRIVPEKDLKEEIRDIGGLLERRSNIL
jgi:hypothetical protein